MAMKHQQNTRIEAGEAAMRDREETSDEDMRSGPSTKTRRREQGFSPRAVLDDLFERARGIGEGSGDFVGNLGATVRDNPIPVMLLAAGVASLVASERMSGGRRSRARGRLEDWDEDDGSALTAMTSKAREAAGELGEKASELGERAKERGTAVRERMRGTMLEVRQKSARTLEEEPFVVVGLGLALGALLGAGLPVTERERRTLGPARERLLERAREVARQGAERVREGAERVRDGAERLKDVAERAGANAGTGRSARDAERERDDRETDEKSMES
jgi:ElaB/YqjD/DUF883 family membrane-anchored ribosome-binding protein